jgi:hypothetical protein
LSPRRSRRVCAIHGLVMRCRRGNGYFCPACIGCPMKSVTGQNHRHKT